MGPATPTPSAESESCCAHLRVKWCTEDEWMDVPRTSQAPGGRHLVTRGWWQCSLCPAKFVPALALDAAKEQTRRDTERETAQECMRIVCRFCFYARVDDPEEWRPAHHDPKHGWLHRYGNTPNVADCKAEHIRRAFPLVPAPAADTKEKA